MTSNMGYTDRAIRLLSSALLLLLFLTGVVSGLYAVLLVILGAALLVTSFTGFCPVYSLLRHLSYPNKPETP